MLSNDQQSTYTLFFSGILKYLKYIDKSKNKKRYLTLSLINFFSKRLTKHYLPLKQSYQPREPFGISTLVHIEKHKVQWARVDLFMFNEGHYIRKEDSPCPGGLPWPIFESCRDEVHGGGDYSWQSSLARIYAGQRPKWVYIHCNCPVPAGWCIPRAHTDATR